MLRLGGREYTSHPDDEQLKRFMDIRLFILLYYKHYKYFIEKLGDKFIYFKSTNPTNY